MVNSKAACYFTGGHTEYGSMVKFLIKINRSIYYERRCPCKEKYRKAARLLQQEGASGRDLRKRIRQDIQDNFISKNRAFSYDLLIVEDDLDFRFHGLSQIEIQERISQYRKTLEAVLKQTPDYTQIKIIFLFASPELETWFLADWEHSFKQFYISRLQFHAGSYFNNRLYQYICGRVIIGFKEQLESYFVPIDELHPDKSKKLSEQLALAIKTVHTECLLAKHNTEIAASLQKHNLLGNFSKDRDGQEMLEHILPSIVARECRIYFASAYNCLRTFGQDVDEL